MGEKALLGIDIGGTTIKFGLVSKEGQLIDKASCPTEPLVNDRACRGMLDEIAILLNEHDLTRDDVEGCGLAIPGPVDQTGRILFVPNATIDLPVAIRACQRALPRANVIALNDANAAAMGELWQGSGRGYDDFAFVILGTGVGAGIVQGGLLLVGANGAAGEFGHMCVNPNETEVCGCGRHGCLEQYCSARGLIRLYREECGRRGQAEVPIAHRSDALAVFNAARAHDEAAKAALDTFADILAFALANVATVIDPQAFVIGGGLSGAFDLYGDRLVERFKAHALPSSQNIDIVAAALGNDAGKIGAAYQAYISA